MLGFCPSESHSFTYFCESHSAKCNVEEDKIYFNKKTYYPPESPIVNRESRLIESKLTVPVCDNGLKNSFWILELIIILSQHILGLMFQLSEAINGEPLGDNPKDYYKPHTCFDPEGRLISGPVIGRPIGENVCSGFSVIPTLTAEIKETPISMPIPSFTFTPPRPQKKEPEINPELVEEICEDYCSLLMDEVIYPEVESTSGQILEYLHAEKLRFEEEQRRFAEDQRDRCINILVQEAYTKVSVILYNFCRYKSPMSDWKYFFGQIEEETMKRLVSLTGAKEIYIGRCVKAFAEEEAQAISKNVAEELLMELIQEAYHEVELEE